MKRRLYTSNRLSLALVLIAIMVASTTAYTAETITFNDPQSLLTAAPWRLGDRGISLTEAVSYTEKRMVFTDGVNPPDDDLPEVRQCNGGHVRFGHFHLEYEDPTINSFGFNANGKFVAGRRTTAGVFQPLANPQNEPRTLGPMSSFGRSGAVVQIIYDPKNNGVPAPFNLISIDVKFDRDASGNRVSRKVNVGTKSSTTGISVYNNLTSGFRWFLLPPPF